MAVDALGSISAGPLSLTIGETFTDNIASTSDVDYFKISSSDISVPSTATVTFTGLSSTTNNNEFVVTIRDSSDAVLNTLTTGISGTVSAAVGSSQPYYIRVEDGSTFDNSNYGIKVDITPTSESELASSPIDNGSVASSNHLIDNVSFWDVSLTNNEIQTYMSCPPSGNEPNLFAFWNFSNKLKCFRLSKCGFIKT